MKSRLAVVGLGVYLAACEATRNAPAPKVMCQELVEACEGTPFTALDSCYAIGVAGLKNARDEDQCYAVYDDCIADCRYVQAALLDASPDAATGDAATVSDAASVADATTVPDATVSDASPDAD